MTRSSMKIDGAVKVKSSGSSFSFEYNLMKGVDPSQITEANLNAKGAQGWRLVMAQERSDGKWNAIFIRG